MKLRVVSTSLPPWPSEVTRPSRRPSSSAKTSAFEGSVTRSNRLLKPAAGCLSLLIVALISTRRVSSRASAKFGNVSLPTRHFRLPLVHHQPADQACDLLHPMLRAPAFQRIHDLLRRTWVPIA